MLISESFAAFKARQNNIQWSVSAFNDSGELVVSLWFHKFEKRSKETITYVDHVSRWSGLGNKEFTKNIDHAYKNDLVVRAIIARTKQPDVVDSGGAANNLGNTFNPKLDWIGKVTLWDGDNFEIEFKKV
jgi:hypothetical protein